MSATTATPTTAATDPPALHRRLPLYALFAANAISLVGSQVTYIAIPWFVLVTTGSAAKTGLTAFAEALAAVLAAFAGGAAVDRLGHKRASVLADVASGAMVGAIPALHFTVGLAFWQLLALVFLRSLWDTPGTTARSALVPELCARAGMPLERANAVIQAVGRGARLLGSPLAGLLVALLGASRVLWLDAASFALSAALVGVAVPLLVVHTEARERYLDEIVAGLRFIRRERLLLVVAATVAVTNFLESPLYAVALPVYVKRTFGSAVDLGVLMAAVGGGAMVGAIVFGALGARLPRRATFTAAFIVLGLPYWALAALPPLAVAAVALVVAGLAAGPINPILATLNQERVPAELRGRVFGTITALAYVATPLGVLLGGVAIEWVGLRATIAAIAAGYLLTTLTLLVNPALREMDGRSEK